MTDLNPRIRALCDLAVTEARDVGGRHEYDGIIQDLSPQGVKAGLAGLARVNAEEPALADRYDEAEVRVFGERMLVQFGRLEMHRSNPLFHLDAMDLTCYDREYAPLRERAAAQAAALAAWPRAADAAVAALDRLPAPVATAMVGPVKGLGAGIPVDADPAARRAAIAAHSRLVAHFEQAAADGDPDAAMGATALAELLGSAEGVTVDLGEMAAQADAERDRLRDLLAESCAAIDKDRPPMDVARDLVKDHPDADGVLDAARRWTKRAIEFTTDRQLVPFHDGECLVGLAPESRRWAPAMIVPAAPGEDYSQSWFFISPPDPSWPEQDIEEWLEVFSDATLPAITVHEVAPGHFSHFGALRLAPTDARRTLHSAAFIEGWGCYAEELCVEEGFGADDPRIAVGIWLQALVRVTRMACAIGVHSGAMTIEEGGRRFAADTHLAGAAALAETRRALFDPTYGRYTWGKLEILKLRDRARKQWGAGFTLRRFHAALMDLGSPPLGLLGTALDSG